MNNLSKIKTHLVINRDAYVLGALTGAFVWGIVVMHHELKAGAVTIKISRENVE